MFVIIRTEDENDKLKNENKKLKNDKEYLTKCIVSLARPPGSEKPFLFNITGHIIDYNLMKLLIEHGADVNARENKISGKIDVKSIQNRSKAALHVAENPEIVKLLIDNGADVNIVDGKHRTPIFYTNLHYDKSAEVAKLLIDNGADVNIEDDEHKTPLHYVKSMEVAKLLIDAGADCSHHYKSNKRDISVIYDIDNLDIVWYIIQRFPKTFSELEDIDKLVLMARFVEANNIEFIKFVIKEHKTLLDWCPKVNSRSILTFATTKEMFKLLVLNGAKIEKATKWFNQRKDDDKVWKSSELFQTAWRLDEESKQFEYIGFL